jgi:hypothetical protein
VIRRERNKKDTNRKGGVKLFLVTDDMVLYLKVPKYLELINAFIKVAGYKTSVQKSVTFLHTHSKLAEKEIRKTIPFATTSKNVGIDLTKEEKETVQ